MNKKDDKRQNNTDSKVPPEGKQIRETTTQSKTTAPVVVDSVHHPGFPFDGPDFGAGNRASIISLDNNRPRLRQLRPLCTIYHAIPEDTIT